MTQKDLPGLEAENFRVLFVCTGNICRSPTAEGVFRHLVTAAGLNARITMDSAGTHDYHVGDPPDPRSVAAAKARGFDLSALRARKVKRQDFYVFDLILAMDDDHHRYLTALRPNDAKAEVKMFLAYHPAPKHREVPDPYYGGAQGFNDVLDMVEEAGRALLNDIKRGL
jgi:protein-tyrosine phosphatase